MFIETKHIKSFIKNLPLIRKFWQKLDFFTSETLKSNNRLQIISQKLDLVTSEGHNLEQKLDLVTSEGHNLEQKLDLFGQALINPKPPFYDIKEAIKKVEFYQPIYGLPFLNSDQSQIKRECLDRCLAIKKILKNDVRHLRILDIGSSLGYFSFYFADRGASVTGWDINPENIIVSQLAQKYNCINANFKNKQLDLDTIENIDEGEYDAIFLLSVLHHIIAQKKLPYVQKLLSKLLDKVPLLVVELALKDETNNVFWHNKIPANELKIFAKCKNIRITKVGEFSTHLSNKKRPIYLVTKKYLSINHKKYFYNKFFWKAYKNSPEILPRSYYQSNSFFIKKYYSPDTSLFDANQKLIINEIANYLSLYNKNSNIPELIDYQIGDNLCYLVLKNIEGKLLSDCLPKINPQKKQKIIKMLIKIFSQLETLGIYHNDIRTWNIIIDSQFNPHLIDLGHAKSYPTENNIASFVWLIWSLINDTTEPTEYNKDFPSQKLDFTHPLYQEFILPITKNKVVTFMQLQKLLSNPK